MFGRGRRLTSCDFNVTNVQASMMKNPRGFHQISKSKRNLQKNSWGLSRKQRMVPKCNQQRLHPRLGSYLSSFIVVGFLLQLLAAKAEDFEYTTCFLLCLQVRVQESDGKCCWYFAVAHRSFKRVPLEVFLSVGHAGDAAPQLPQCTFRGSEV